MNQKDELISPPGSFGDWQDAETLRRWSFARRTPQQRLDWLVEVLTISHEAAAARAAAQREPKAPQ